jgi:hypothetical protein
MVFVPNAIAGNSLCASNPVCLFNAEHSHRGHHKGFISPPGTGTQTAISFTHSLGRDDIHQSR